MQDQAIREEFAPHLLPGEEIRWLGQTHPFAMLLLVWPYVLWLVAILAYFLNTPIFTDLVDAALAQAARVAFALFDDYTIEVTIGWIRACATLAAGVYFGFGLFSLVGLMASSSRTRHAVTNLRIISIESGKARFTYLRNVAMIQYEATRTYQSIVVFVAGLKVRHSILGARGLPGAEIAINQGILEQGGAGTGND